MFLQRIGLVLQAVEYARRLSVEHAGKLAFQKTVIDLYANHICFAKHLLNYRTRLVSKCFLVSLMLLQDYNVPNFNFTIHSEFKYSEINRKNLQHWFTVELHKTTSNLRIGSICL